MRLMGLLPARSQVSRISDFHPTPFAPESHRTCPGTGNLGIWETASGVRNEWPEWARNSPFTGQQSTSALQQRTLISIQKRPRRAVPESIKVFSSVWIYRSTPADRNRITKLQRELVLHLSGSIRQPLYRYQRWCH